MPKRLFVDVELPVRKPERCVDCPLLGIIPKERREGGYKSQQTRVCIGTRCAMSERLTKAKASVVRSGGHRLERPCDRFWEMWHDAPGRVYPVHNDVWMEFRAPYERMQQMVINYDWNKRGRKKKDADGGFERL